MPPPNAASAGDGAGAASANSCSASPGRGRLQDVVVAARARAQRVERVAGLAALARARRASPSGLATSAWLRSSSICAASRLSGGSAGRNRCDICSPRHAGVRRMKRPTTWRKNSSVRALVA